MTSRVDQGPITIGVVTPTGGGVGTLVRIEGTGFTIDAVQTSVLFGGAVGRIESVSGDRDRGPCAERGRRRPADR